MENSRKFKGNSLLKLVDNYVLVDIETTGFSPIYDDIIEIGAVKVKNNKIIDEYQRLIKANRPLSRRISDLTGITNKMLLTSGDNIDNAMQDFLDFAEDDVLIAHNANFDINFLYDKASLYLNEYLDNDFIDTMRISKRLLPNLPNYKLSTLADYFNVDYTGAHRGLVDVKITYDVYNHLKALEP